MQQVYGEVEPCTEDAFVRHVHDDTVGFEANAGRTARRSSRWAPR